MVDHQPENVIVVVYDQGAAAPATAQLAGELSLPFHDQATVIRLTDKLAQRRALSEAGADGVRCGL